MRCQVGEIPPDPFLTGISKKHVLKFYERTRIMRILQIDTDQDLLKSVEINLICVIRVLSISFLEEKRVGPRKGAGILIFGMEFLFLGYFYGLRWWWRFF